MRGRLIGITVVTALLLALPATAYAAAGAEAPRLAQVGNQFDRAIAFYTDAALELDAAVSSADAAIATAQAALDASTGKVLDERSRSDLGDAIAAAQSLIADAAAAARPELPLDPHPADAPIKIDAITVSIRQLASTLSDVIGALPDQSAAVEHAVAAWQAEQDRIAAEAAAAQAAAAAVAEAAAAAAMQADLDSAPAWDGIHRVYVNGWGDTWSAQALLDSGGQWAIDYGVGVTDVSAHNFNDATALGLNVGDVVEFSGAIGGRYVVTGESWVPQGSNASALWALGTPVVMQTCAFGSTMMRLVGLAPI